MTNQLCTDCGGEIKDGDKFHSLFGECVGNLKAKIVSLDQRNDRLIGGIRMCYESYGIESVGCYLPPDIKTACDEATNANPNFKPKLQQLESQVASLTSQLATAQKVVVLADKLLDVMNEFPDDPSTYGEYTDALFDAIAAIGEKELAEMKYGKQTNEATV